MTRNELTKLWAKVTGKFNALIGGAPEALDTLKEIADKLGDDDDALAGLLTQVGGKQDALVSGQNIKSINGQSVLGEGNLELGELFVVTMTQHNSVYTADKSVSEIYEASYTNGKPVIAVMRDINNPVFILTDCDPDGDSYVFSAIESNSVTTLRWQRTDDYTYELETMALQPHLVSGTNIKTVNNESLLGSGNVDIVGKSAYQSYVDTTTDSPVKTEAEWIASLKGEDGVSLGDVAIADDLDTDDARKVLSARQGYNLGQKVNDVDAEPTASSEKFVKSGGVAAVNGHYEENPEWIRVVTDKDGRILEGIKNDGTKVIAAGAEINGDINTDGAGIVVTDNPEFIDVKLDAEGKILWAIKADGSIYYGAGIPQQVKDYIEEKISSLSLDEYEDIVAFLSDYLGSDTTLKVMIDSINERIPEIIVNPEFIEVTTDSEDKVLEGIHADGTKVIGGNLSVGGSAKVLGNMEVSGVSYRVIESPEYIAAWVDAEDKVIFGFKADGKTYVGDANFLDDIEEIKAFLVNFNDKNIDWDALASITATENPEFIESKIDSEGKLLAGRTPDGAAFENVGFSTPKVSIDGHTIENIEDPEERSEISTDAEGKVISYRDADGVKHENVGIEPANIIYNEKTKGQVKVFAKETISENNEEHGIVTPENHYPKWGTVNIKQETFYLTADARYSDKNGVYLIQDYPDTDVNATNGVTLSYFYIKSTLTDNGDGTYSKNENSVKLDFYAASKVTKVGDNYYVTESLDGGSVVPESIEVTQIIDAPPYMAWPVDKKTEHYCLVDIDFGHYLNKNNIPVGVKYQGSSTLRYRKRNFRFTFYKNSDYKKKDKVKIGDWLRLSGYNLKANWSDFSRIKECVLYRTILPIWELRPENDRYPWDKEYGMYTGATGTIKGFPISVSVGGEFYGLDVFGLKKDEKNYMLDGDDDASGIFVSCDALGAPQAWTVTTAANWSDEMEAVKPMSQETTDALNTFFDFINDRLYKGSDNNYYNVSELTDVDGTMYVTSTLQDGSVVEGSISATLEAFNRENAPQRMDIQGFIDYFICLQTFQMWDNGYRNMILYTGRDKKKFYPFMYDLDLSLGKPYDEDFFDMTSANPSSSVESYDWHIWDKMVELYWDEIVNRYSYLRNKVLNITYITKLYHDVADNIPDNIFTQEYNRWQRNADKTFFEESLQKLDLRFGWLDESYFKI